jgi:hypothetical protein
MPAREPPAWRLGLGWVAFLLGSLCFLACLPLDPVRPRHDTGVGSGLELYFFGWLQAAYVRDVGTFVALAWCTNPLLGMAWAGALARYRWARWPALASVTIGACFLFGKRIHASGSIDDIVGVGAGYALWLASAVLILVAALARQRPGPGHPGRSGPVIAALAIAAYVALGLATQREDVEIDNGVATVSLLAGSTTYTGAALDGVGRDATFFEIESLDFARNGDLLVNGAGMRRITPGGRVTTDTVAAPGMSFTGQITVGPDGRSWMLGRKGIPTHVALFLAAADGSASERPVQWPGNDNTFNGPAIDHAGNVYLTHWSANTVVKITPDGALRIFAGDGAPGLRDGPGSIARFAGGGTLWLDASDTLFLCDLGNDAIRQIDASGNTSTWLRLPHELHADDCQHGRDGKVYLSSYERGVSRVYTVGQAQSPRLLATIPRRLAGLQVDAAGTIYAAMRHDALHRPAGVLRITPHAP